ncbi:MAG: hypothetical protein D6696_15585 [Acidobacteria bacterium]|nr:MAG: hypothetical protein D6696_15585 [Acidobacteriota bacterium]
MTTASSSPVARYRALKIAASVLFIVVALLLLAALDGWLFDQEVQVLVPDDQAIDRDAVDQGRLHTALTKERYLQWLYHENQQVYSWQRRSTKILFWVSMLVSIGGLAMAFWQFALAASEAEGAVRLETTTDQEISIKTNLASLAIRTRSIAALVMFMSLAYLFVYVFFVYPINSNGQQDPIQTSSSSSTTGAFQPSKELIEVVKQNANQPPKKKE